MDVILQPVSDEALKGLTKQQLITLVRGEQNIREQLTTYIDELKEQYANLKDESLEIHGQFVRLKKRLFCPSTEKKPKPKKKRGSKGSRKLRNKTSRLPSERYPNIPVEEVDVELEAVPDCPCCQGQMVDSGMAEVSEELTTIPKKFFVRRLRRKKYRCGKCHGSIVTTPAIPKIIPKSSYSDEMILDVALSKYCDLIPVERMTAMAERQGIDGLPPNSLIGLTHKLADFFEPIYAEGLRKEILGEPILHADETTHRMLEGDDKKSWYLWGFSGKRTAYFEMHDSRSGDIPSSLLGDCRAEVLVCDVYAGYKKAIRIVNEDRQSTDKADLVAAFCNAHARRRFCEAEDDFAEALYYKESYERLYEIESDIKDKPPDKARKGRIESQQIMNKMLIRARTDKEQCSNSSSLARAINYLTNNFDGLVRFTSDPAIPIDNKPQERLLRSPVIGRKTWYGTHSKRGAKTAAILFSLVESCKLNKVNPRQYFRDTAQSILLTGEWKTPKQYRSQDK